MTSLWRDRIQRSIILLLLLSLGLVGSLWYLFERRPPLAPQRARLVLQATDWPS